MGAIGYMSRSLRALAVDPMATSLMGAAAVKWPTSPQVMATHFGISLVCLASAALVAFILIEERNGGAARRTQAEATSPSAGAGRSAWRGSSMVNTHPRPGTSRTATR